MQPQTEKKLQSMLNVPFMYGIKQLTIRGYSVDTERRKVFLHTNECDNHFERPFDSMNALLKEFQPVDTAAAKDSQAVIAVNNTTSVVDELRKVLMENIDLVRKDKAYIPQATAINNNVNSIINLSKLQMEAVKMSAKFGTNE